MVEEVDQLMIGTALFGTYNRVVPDDVWLEAAMGVLLALLVMLPTAAIIFWFHRRPEQRIGLPPDGPAPDLRLSDRSPEIQRERE